jgi:hypothetical protein
MKSRKQKSQIFEFVRGGTGATLSLGILTERLLRLALLRDRCNILVTGKLR